MLIPSRVTLSALALALSVVVVVACGPGSDDDGIHGTESMLADCRKLPVGPWKPVALGHPFQGSEDFAFDGHGSMVARRGNALARVNGKGKVTSEYSSLQGQTLGLRFHPKGNLIGAMVSAGKIVSVAPSGQVTDLVTGLNGPNGIYLDPDANLWFTEGGANRVSRLAADGKRTTIVSGPQHAQGANGVVVDAKAKRLFYTEYDKGKIHRVDLAAQNPSPAEVWWMAGAGFDGLVLDACGNLYAVDQRNSKLFRFRLGANGAVVGTAELLATFPVNVANAQFGSGDGFDPNTLYVVGNPGSVFAIPLGVSGAPIPAPPGH